ncbi:MAG: hypothetical protein RL208_798 [Pseudomonadota bacterium]
MYESFLLFFLRMLFGVNETVSECSSHADDEHNNSPKKIIKLQIRINFLNRKRVEGVREWVGVILKK